MKQLSMDELTKITEAIIGAAIEVHRHLGPGLLESAYRECLRYELIQRGYDAQQEIQLPLTYKEVKLDCGYRMDLLVKVDIVQVAAKFSILLAMGLVNFLRLRSCVLRHRPFCLV